MNRNGLRGMDEERSTKRGKRCELVCILFLGQEIFHIAMLVIKPILHISSND